MQRFSKKRQAILDCLCSTTTHPPAEWIYEQLQPAYPTLSLATVYRNLSQLKTAGAIRSLGVVNGHERFDGNITPHSHLVCSCCGTILDITGAEPDARLVQALEESTGYTIQEASLQFRGLCRDCKGNGQALPGKGIQDPIVI